MRTILWKRVESYVAAYMKKNRGTVSCIVKDADEVDRLRGLLERAVEGGIRAENRRRTKEAKR